MEAEVNGQLANRIDNVVVSGDKPFARFDNNSVIDRTTDIGNRTCCPNARLSTDETVSAHLSHREGSSAVPS